MSSNILRMFAIDMEKKSNCLFCLKDTKKAKELRTIALCDSFSKH